MCVHTGVRTAAYEEIVRRTVLERPSREGERPVSENESPVSRIQSTARHVEPCGKKGGPPPKAKYYLVTDSA